MRSGNRNEAKFIVALGSCKQRKSELFGIVSGNPYLNRDVTKNHIMRDYRVLRNL